MLHVQSQELIHHFNEQVHAAADKGFLIRDLIEVTLSNRYRVIPLLRDTKRGTRFDAVLDPAIVDGQTTLGLAVSAEMEALELVAAVPVRFKISSPTNIDDIVRLALSGVKLTHMAQVPAAVPVRPNTHYFSLENKGMLFEAMLKAQALTLDAPAGMSGLNVELFCLAK